MTVSGTVYAYHGTSSYNIKLTEIARMTSKLKTDVLETVSGSGTIALTNQLSGMTSASVPL